MLKEASFIVKTLIRLTVHVTGVDLVKVQVEILAVLALYSGGQISKQFVYIIKNSLRSLCKLFALLVKTYFAYLFDKLYNKLKA